MWRDVPRENKAGAYVIVLAFFIVLGPVKGLFYRWWDGTGLQDLVITIAYWLVAGTVVFLLGEYAHRHTHCESRKSKGRTRSRYFQPRAQIVLCLQLVLFLAFIGPARDFLFDRLRDTWFPEFVVMIAYWIVAVLVIGFLSPMVARQIRGVS